jgi:response regulator RpfG family c-di-GMP phosphodiesterase
VTEKILFVDDEPNVLAGFERQLRKRYAIETAPGGAEGLVALASRGPFAVVVSDMRMPVMDGVQFLRQAHERYPDTTRMLLTGYADLRSAIDVVNQGHIFRFLTKPCPPEALAAALDAALAQYRLQCAERELLDRTLRGSVQVLGEVLALVNPTAFGQAVRVQQLVRELAPQIDGAGDWAIDVAAVLSRLGCVTVPESLIAAVNRGADLGPAERHQLAQLPNVTRDLLRPIPRLEQVLEIIAYLDVPFDHKPCPGTEKTGKAIPLGARLLKLAFEFDTLVARGLPRAQALTHVQSRAGCYDPDLLTVLESRVLQEQKPEVREVWASELVSGMLLAEDVYSDTGVLLLSRGSPITEPLKRRLEATAGRGQTPKRIRVLVPRTTG